MVGMVDYGMGNLRSVEKALERGGATVKRITAAADFSGVTGLVVPGQGAFRDCVACLRQAGLWAPIIDWIGQGKPYLGICLGQQALFTTSFENGRHEGLGVFEGTVERFEARGQKIPQIGWNRVAYARGGCPIFEGIPDGTHFYFDHSYVVKPADPDAVAATTDYAGPFASAVWRGACFAVQFHPEKSQAAGLKLLKNFVSLCP